MKKIEFGLMTFADMKPEDNLDKGINAHQRLKDLIEEAKLADQLGMDVFGLGEHHRDDYASSSPVTILSAIAAVTENIKLSTGVTVLSSEDPVRVYQQFSTLDLLSSGRAEIMAGRGSFTESFPLFGYKLEDYNELFEEKLDMLLKINKEPILKWEGKHRASVNNLGVFPRALDGEIPVWIAAGGTPASALRAARLKLPLMLAIIGGALQNFIPFVDYYKKSALEFGTKPEALQVGINNHVFVGEDDESISKEFYPYYAEMMDRVGRSRGWQKISKEQFDWMRSSEGSLMVGSVDKVVDKLVYEYQIFGFTRFLAQASLGWVPHELTMKSIELFASEVIPRFKKRVGIEE